MHHKPFQTDKRTSNYLKVKTLQLINSKASKDFNKSVVSQQPHQEPKREDLYMVLFHVIDYKFIYRKLT